MHVEDLDIAPGKIGETAQRIIDRAIEEARRREHALLTNEHLFLAFAQVEWDMFSAIMRDVELNPHTILQAIEEHLHMMPSFAGRELRVSPSTKLVFKLALHHGSRAGRQTIESVDVFSAVFEEMQGVPVSILRRHGVEPDVLVARLGARVRDMEQREERLKKRFELPPFLKHFATNLNLLARQDKLPPVYGRDKEIQQVLEILCHRERANSVMLIGEPGVGKTAIVEGLARRIEFEPETVPVRLRDCQVVNLQMNAMVAGTMLRGMFEDRIQNVIRELKERTNLILFVDEAHTMVGAGSALGAPSDAANVLKSALSRGEIRMVAATTLSEYKEYIQEDEAFARRFRSVHRRRADARRDAAHSLQPAPASRAELLGPPPRRGARRRARHVAALPAAPAPARQGHRMARHGGRAGGSRSPVGSEQAGRDVGHLARRADPGRHGLPRLSRIASRTSKKSCSSASSVRRRPSAPSRAGSCLNKGPLKDGFDRPDGVLLFLGPTGVGKTELAKSVAAFLFGDEKKMVRVDMSEYQDGSVAVDKLIGMPRGIVGSERGGILTNQLKDNPCTVVLLDEVEKASPSLLNLFLQAFDEGWLTDGRGKRVYLSDAVIIMTSNLGSEHFRKLTSSMGFRAGHMGVEQVEGEVFRELERRFSPEFRNRIDEVVLFGPLAHDEVREIAKHYLTQVTLALAKAGKTIQVNDDALELIVTKGYNIAFGARFLKRHDRRAGQAADQRAVERRLALHRQGRERRDRGRSLAGVGGGRHRIRGRSVRSRRFEGSRFDGFEVHAPLEPLDLSHLSRPSHL